MKKRSLEERKKLIVDFIKNNPHTTYKLMKEKLRLNPGRAFKSLEEAYKLAGIKPKRNFKIKTPEEKRKIIINYIRKHPGAGGQIIKRDTKINISGNFKSIKEAYKKANVDYPREESYKKPASEKKEELIKLVRKNPEITITELMKKIKTNPYRFFKNIKELYKKAGVKKISGNDKRSIKKRQEVIQFIKNNPLATQREINNSCHTHVQGIFKNGIFDAYKEAEKEFPYERLRVYGVGLKEIRDRAKTFEEKIAIKLSGYGKVNRLVKTKRGFADIVLERKDRKAVIEVKDYELKEISISQINQLNKYLEDCNCNLGFLVCFKKPKKDNFLIGENRIIILEEMEVSRIPEIMGV